MVTQSTNAKGQTSFTGTVRDLNLITDWCRAMLHLAFGEVEGEVRLRRLPAQDMLALWARRPTLPVV